MFTLVIRYSTLVTRNVFSPDSYSRAWWFAAQAHGDQLVPGTELPYIVHIGNVAMEVLASLSAEPAPSPDLAVQCALLHDVIEDTPVEVDNLDAVFGPEVTAGVLALTKDKTLKPKQAQMIDSLHRIQEQPREVWRVKLADRISNLRQPPGHWSRGKIIAYRDEAELILESLQHGSDYLAERLARKIEQYTRFINDEI